MICIRTGDTQHWRTPNLWQTQLYLFNHCCPSKNGETALAFAFLGYGSKINILKKHNIYMTLGRLIKEEKGAWHCFFNPEISLDLGATSSWQTPAPAWDNMLIGKVWAMGFGTIAGASEVEGSAKTGGAKKNLDIFMDHCDYNTKTKRQVTFRTKYIVPGNSLFHNTFLFFEEGVEALMIGKVTGFDKEVKIWHVLIYFFCITSNGRGSQATALQVNGSNTTSLGPRIKMLGASRSANASRSTPRLGNGLKDRGNKRTFDDSNVLPT
ncbi:hypothetical protein PSTT_10873 [Puccinia striiformis]|uniref:Uncharacterized protein n=1 Tax=Puccinia striiformis TaxID=27350 RepID=A0A2S4V2E4_9BASI|nr:hypothetical protein PSTT_10873 [Puccinia striiformis]